MDEFWRVDKEGTVVLLLVKGVDSICNRVMAEVGGCILVR